MGQQFRDEAGNIWEQGPNGPVFVSGPQQSIQTKPADPKLPGQLQGQNLNNAQTVEQLRTAPIQREGQVLSNNRTAQDITLDRGKALSALTQQFGNEDAIKAYRQILPNVAKALAAPDTAAGDNNIIFSYAKSNDPIGSVHESDTDSAKRTADLIGQLKAKFGMIKEGDRLPPKARRELIQALRATATQFEKGYAETRQHYADIAKSSGFDPNLVIGPHEGGKYNDLERQFAGKSATPHDFDRILGDMIEQQKPVAEIRKTLKEYGSSIPPWQEKILDQYEGARLRGESPQVKVETLPGQSAALGLAKGFKGAWDRAAVGVQGAYNAIPGLPDTHSASDAQQVTQDYFAGQNVDPTAETVGRLAGSTLLAAPIRGPMLAGAAGNLLMTDSQGLDAAKDAAFGAAGGKIADTVLRGAAQLVAPQLDQSVTNLANEGARLTPGRFFPGLKKTEDLARSYPIVGSKIDDAMRQAEVSVNRIPPNRILGRIGEQLPEDVPAGHEAVKYTGAKVGDFYEQNLAGRAFNIDPEFVKRLNVMGMRSKLRPQELEQFSDIAQREVGGMFANGLGRASARDFKKLDSRLGHIASKLQNSADDPFKVDLGNSVEQLQEQVRHLFRRQNPDVADNLRAADNAWADFVPYQRAASSALEDGIATPGQFRAGVRQSDRSLRKGATARGEARMQDFAIDASKVIPAERGNPGTADRLNLGNLKAWGIGAATSPLYSEPSINALNALVKRKPDKVSETIAKALRLPNTRGMFGAGLPLWLQSGN